MVNSYSSLSLRYRYIFHDHLLHCSVEFTFAHCDRLHVLKNHLPCAGGSYELVTEEQCDSVQAFCGVNILITFLSFRRGCCGSKILTLHDISRNIYLLCRELM